MGRLRAGGLLSRPIIVRLLARVNINLIGTNIKMRFGGGSMMDLGYKTKEKERPMHSCGKRGAPGLSTILFLA